MLLATKDNPQTMSHIELAEVVGCRPDNVKRTIDTLCATIDKNGEPKNPVIRVPQRENLEYINNLGHSRTRVVYHVNQRDSYVVVAQLSPKKTADLVDRWQELESGESIGKGSLPKNFICGDSSLLIDFSASAIAGLPEFNEKHKTFILDKDFVVKKFTISRQGTTYMKMPAWIMDYAENGYKRMIFVTNKENPNIKQTAKYVENMRKLAGDNLKICFLTDEFASLNVEPSKRALLCAPM